MLEAPSAAGEWIVWSAAVTTALGVLWRQALRPAWRSYKAARDKLRRVHDLIERELQHNGGSSLKDHAAQVATVVQNLASSVEDLRRNDQAITDVLDNLARSKADEHSAIWQALAEHGIDRRKDQP